MPVTTNLVNNPNPAEKFQSVVVGTAFGTESSGALIRCKALYVGTAGDIVVLDEALTSVTFVGVQAGSVLPIRTHKVDVGTTASNIIALF